MNIFQSTEENTVMNTDNNVNEIILKNISYSHHQHHSQHTHHTPTKTIANQHRDSGYGSSPDSESFDSHMINVKM